MKIGITLQVGDLVVLLANSRKANEELFRDVTLA